MPARSRHVVLAGDRHQGNPGGYLSLEQMISDHQLSLDAPTNATGANGQHLWYSAPEGTPSAFYGPGVEIKGTGTYVVMPPSLHHSTRRYMELISPRDCAYA